MFFLQPMSENYGCLHFIFVQMKTNCHYYIQIKIIIHPLLAFLENNTLSNVNFYRKTHLKLYEYHFHRISVNQIRTH